MTKLWLRIETKNGSFRTISFTAEHARNEWLRANGYFESGGVHRNLSGLTAGRYSDADSQAIKDRCCIPVKPRSVMGGLCTI